LSAADGRKFGLTVGAAFLVFGGIALWRGKQRSATVLFTLGGLLVVAALMFLFTAESRRAGRTVVTP